MRLKRRFFTRSLCMILVLALLPVSAFATSISATDADSTTVTILQEPRLENADVTSSSMNDASFTTMADGITVSIRVIGVTLPTEKLDFWSTAVDYKDAVHQNWIQTTTYENVPAQTGARDFLEAKLNALGFVAKLSGTSGYVTATALFGEQKLENSSGDAGWFYDIYDANGSLRVTAAKMASSNHTLQDGDSVILHYLFDSAKEATGATGNYGIYAGQFLKRTPDAALADYEKAYGAEALIKQIGTVTAGSGGVIKEARDAYDALNELQCSLVRNYAVLTAAEEVYAGMDQAVKLSRPAPPELLGRSANSIALVKAAASEEDPAATVQYRMSADNVRWGEWQESNVFTKLRAETTYYFQTRYWPSDLTLYEESEPSESVTITTDSPPVYTASNREEWVNLVVNAPTDGREIVIEIVNDIEVGVSGVFTTSTPGGSNITMVGKGGKLLSPGGGQFVNGICVGNGATLTLRDLEYSSIGPWGDTNGKEQQTGNANFGSMIYLGGSGCTVNLENVTMYGDCTQTGAIISNGTSANIAYRDNVINIYSGALDQIGGGSYGDVTGSKSCTLIEASGCTVNLRPEGDIILEGVIQCDSLRIIPETKRVNAVSSSSGDFATRVDLAADLDIINSASDLAPYKVNITSCGGVRVIVSENGTAFPQKLDAPEVRADMFEVDKESVSVPCDLVSAQQPHAILQYRVFESSNPGRNLLPYQKWMSRPMTFDIELNEDTEYIFELRYNAIGGNYANSDTTAITLRTGYTTKALEAPNLITAKEKTIHSITLKAPAASEQDGSAVAMYRMSQDGQSWEENWQKEPLFEDLEAGTIYYFQAQFVSNSYLWTSSEPSNTLQVMTRTAILEAPVLSSVVAGVSANTITLTAPEMSEQDRGATMEYRIAKNQAALEEATWQTSETFTMLQPQTTYYFQARYISSTSAWRDSDASAAIAVETLTSAQSPTFAVSNVSGSAGETVTVNIYVDGNPGLAAAKLTVQYDSTRVTLLDDAALGSVMGGFVPGKERIPGERPFVFYTTDLCNTTKNGVLATLNFQIHADCGQGEIPVNVTYAADDVYDEDDENVSFDVQNGSIYVVTSGEASYIYGDVNSDGTVGHKDVTFLIRYLAEYDVTIDEAAADLNKDEAVDLLDLLILRRHLAGWSSYGILPY